MVKKIEINEKEGKIIGDLKRKIIVYIAENFHVIEGESRKLDLITIILCITICDILNGFNVHNKDDIESYMFSLSRNVANNYDAIKADADSIINRKENKTNE